MLTLRDNSDSKPHSILDWTGQCLVIAGHSDLKGVFEPREWHDSVMAAWDVQPTGLGEETACCSSRHSEMLQAPGQGLWERLSVCSLAGRHRDWPRRMNVMKTFHDTSAELRSPSPEKWRFKEPWSCPVGFGLTMEFLLGFNYIPHWKRLLKESFSLLYFSLLSTSSSSRQLDNLNLSCILELLPLSTTRRWEKDMDSLEIQNPFRSWAINHHFL